MSTKKNSKEMGVNVRRSSRRGGSSKKEDQLINVAVGAAVADVESNGKKAASHSVAVAVSAGAAAVPAVPAGRVSGVVSEIMENSDIKVINLRSSIAANWAAPEWSGAAALRASLEAIGTLTAEQINAAVAAAGRKSGESLEAVTPSINEVCEYISNNFANEFKAVCGCACPADNDARLYTPTSLSLATITANSVLSDYVVTSSIPAGLSASGIVAAVMSVRFLVDVRRRFAAARAAARNEFRSCMAGAARRALALGVSPAVASRYFAHLLNAVPIADESDKKRLTKNLAGCWASLRRIENAIVLAGGRGAIEDGFGGWCFPAAGVAAVVPVSGVGAAKVRKLWAKRVRVLSSIDTLNGLLARC